MMRPRRKRGANVRRRWRLAMVGMAMVVLAAGCSSGGPEQGPTPTASGSATVKKGGILRIGTLSYIDSLNPYNYIESQATVAMEMVYPQLVQYTWNEADGFKIEGDWATTWETSADGKDWTFHLIPGAKWTDGQPLTAGDAAWSVNTTVKYANGPTAEEAPALSHVASADATDPATLVIHYDAAVGNALEQLEQFWVLPQHVWEPLVGSNGRGLKTYRPEQHLPLVAGGAYSIKSYEKKGTTVYIPNPGYYGTPSNAEAIALTYYTNTDSMVADLERDQLDWVDQVPFNAVKAIEGNKDLVINKVPGSETTNITWNDEPRQDLQQGAAGPPGQEGPVDVHRPPADHRRGLQRLRRHGREPGWPHLAAGEPEPGAAGVRLRCRQPDARPARVREGLGRDPGRPGLRRSGRPPDEVRDR